MNIGDTIYYNGTKCTINYISKYNPSALTIIYNNELLQVSANDISLQEPIKGIPAYSSACIYIK